MSQISETAKLCHNNEISTYTNANNLLWKDSKQAALIRLAIRHGFVSFRRNLESHLVQPPTSTGVMAKCTFSLSSSASVITKNGWLKRTSTLGRRHLLNAVPVTLYTPQYISHYQRSKVQSLNEAYWKRSINTEESSSTVSCWERVWGSHAVFQSYVDAGVDMFDPHRHGCP